MQGINRRESDETLYIGGVHRQVELVLQRMGGLSGDSGLQISLAPAGGKEAGRRCRDQGATL